MDHRIHIFGASGSGTTTLGQLLSKRIDIPHFDTDDYFWEQSLIPYIKKRERSERVDLLKTKLQRFPEWILSGSLDGWGDFTIPLFTLAIFPWIPEEIRIKRLRKREIERYGSEALSPGGWFHENSEAFIAWASKYDSGGMDIRSRALHEQWMKELPCKLLLFEEPLSLDELISKVLIELKIQQT